MCLLEIKKKLNFRFSLVWLLSRKDQVTEQCREGYKPAKHFLWHAACGDRVLNVSAFPLPSHLLKTLTVVAVLFSTCLLFLLLAQALTSSGCCHGLSLRRPMAGDKSQGSCWSLAVSWLECCLWRIGNSPPAANPSGWSILVFTFFKWGGICEEFSLRGVQTVDYFV